MQGRSLTPRLPRQEHRLHMPYQGCEGTPGLGGRSGSGTEALAEIIKSVLVICWTAAGRRGRWWLGRGGGGGGVEGGGVWRRWRLLGGRRGVLPGQGSASFCGADHRLQWAWTGFNSASWSSTAWRGSGGAVLRRDHVARAPRIGNPGQYFYEPVAETLLALVFMRQ